MKTKILIILCCCSSYICFAQDNHTENTQSNTQHTLFLEVFGSAGFYYNITYDYSFALAEKHKIALAAGVGCIAFEDLNFGAPSVSTSMQVNYLYGKKHHLELGTGITFPDLFYIEENIRMYFYHFNIPIRIGYRYQRNDGGFFWKIAFTPYYNKFVHRIIEFPMMPYGGVAIGYTFKNKH